MKITDKYVFFWKEDPFCNFTRCWIKLADPYYVPLEDDLVMFSSSEQMFMWFKAKFFGDEETADLILQSKSPSDARKLGRLVKGYNDREWDKVRVDFMRKAVSYKFMQNADLRKQLLDSKYDGKVFVEAAYYDRIWGIGFNESDAIRTPESHWGRNELGKILTDLRTELKRDET